MKGYPMKDICEIVPLTTDNFLDVFSLFANAGPFVRQRGESDYWLYARLFGDTCFVANAENQIVGALISFIDQTTDFKEIYVQDVAVHPNWRKKGVASCLMRTLFGRISEQRLARMWLTSEAENISARRLWKKFGLENVMGDYEKDGVLITRDLKGPGRDRAVYVKAFTDL
jgi:ribosomal protein S18 acetylase RimI-like enzyme